MTKAYMPFYVGDFLKKTMNLSGVERGCYISLLCHCWEHGHIPTDPRQLARICGVSPKLWWQYEKTVLTFFVPVNEKTMTNERVQKERLRYEEKGKHFKEGAQKRRETLEKSLSNLSDVSCQSDQTNKKEEEKSLPPQAAGHAPLSGEGSKQETPPAGFARFWLAYPKKVSKPAALRAFKQALKRVDLEKMLDALEVQKPTWKDPKYIKQPSRWLNEDCWADEVTKPPAWSLML